MNTQRPRIVLAVTVDMSLRLMRGFPQFLVESGWDVHVVSSPGASLDELEELPGVTTHGLFMAREPSPLADARSFLAWVKLLRSVRPDLLSVGTPKAGLLGGLAGWLTRVPDRVYTLRGLRLETATGTKKRLLNLAEKIAMKSAHRVVAVSESLRSRAIELRLVTPPKIVVLGAGSSNGVDVAEFKRSNFTDLQVKRLRSDLGLVPNVPVIGFVGRLTEDKGLHILAKARILLEHAGVDYQLLIVGGIDDKTSEASLDQIRSSGRTAIETGHVSNPAIYYQLMDLLCLPTLREGFPNVVLEAAAAGVSTITTSATGAIDAVIDGETGLVVRVGDASELSAALAILLGDADRRSRMGASAHNRVQEHYSRTVVWQNTLDNYLRKPSQGSW